MIKNYRYRLYMSASFLVAASAAHAQELETIPAVAPEGAAALAISSDGTIIAGFDGDNAEAWNVADKSSLSLGFEGQANGLSADGGTIVGFTPGENGRSAAFSWTSGAGVTVLPYLSGDGTGFLDESKAHDISDDGSVIVGSSQAGSDTDFNQRAVRWVNGSVESLGTLDNGTNTGSFAYGVSADGLTIVGSSNTADSPGQTAFRWTEAEGMSSLGRLNGGNSSEAYAVSADGAVIVGQASDGNAFSASRAFRWTEAGGLVALTGANSETPLRANGRFSAWRCDCRDRQ